ncbi:hypothetical protein COMA2_30346 [Candidatus Nitrospira nitrificans]|uniref:Uncharacterized protein n=1 Tax=Candidatus Nitrospira nitrificans TaxID=1742973 RepID=A0A0S4LKW1_9BACT|nr:hypothetical protein COMA2_30346 [Candidatus Nitrospira nitrificans]
MAPTQCVEAILVVLQGRVKTMSSPFRGEVLVHSHVISKCVGLFRRRSNPLGLLSDCHDYRPVQVCHHAAGLDGSAGIP